MPERPLLISVSWSWFVYAHPVFRLERGEDGPSSTKIWQRHQKWAWATAGADYDLTQKIGLIESVAGRRMVPPGAFWEQLEEKNVPLNEEGCPLYVGDYMRFALTAMSDIYELTKSKIDVVHFDTRHGLCRCGSAALMPTTHGWLRWAASSGLLGSVLVVFPDWAPAIGLQPMLNDEDVAALPDDHEPIRCVQWKDWCGLPEPRAANGIFVGRSGVLTPPWTDLKFAAFVMGLGWENVTSVGHAEVLRHERPWEAQNSLFPGLVCPKPSKIEDPAGLVLSF